MKHFEFGIDTIGGVADSDVLDRLAALMYEIDELIDPTLALNENGSISASFIVAASDALTASRIAADRFSDALVAAEPLRAPTQEEIDRGSEHIREAATEPGRFEVREAMYA